MRHNDPLVEDSKCTVRLLQSDQRFRELVALYLTASAVKDERRDRLWADLQDCLASEEQLQLELTRNAELFEKVRRTWQVDS